MVLNLTENKILLEMLWFKFRNKPFRFGTQNIVKSHKFFEIMAKLEKDEYININPKSNGTFYTLADRGEVTANIQTNDKNTERKYWRLRREATTTFHESW